MALLAVTAALAVPRAAVGDEGGSSRKTVVGVELPVALPLSQPLRDRFGWGAMPALMAALSARDYVLVGLRLRWGFLSDGPRPADPTIKDPGRGSLAVLSLMARLRPSASHFPDSLLEGPWLDIGVGPALSGGAVRPAGEVALGFATRLGAISLGPSVRYLHVVQLGDSLSGSDASLVLLGLDIGVRDARSAAPASQATAPAPAVADRDGDGIPDAIDKCPDAAEDKDGFQDDDGCPDPDNDKDGIPDEADACPNEPETVNGFDDEDGCPDETPAAALEERVPLEERILFETGQFMVGGEGRAALAKVARKWPQHPEWDRLVIEGHADRRGSDTFNLQLSRDRAAEVHGILVQLGVPAEKLRIRAFGNRRSRVPGEDAEADRENRRVELVAVKKNVGIAPSAADAAAAEAQPKAAPDAQPAAPEDPGR
jgi:outer membrane protein OmpA-like peptidoglycan-associated protein